MKLEQMVSDAEIAVTKSTNINARAREIVRDLEDQYDQWEGTADERNLSGTWKATRAHLTCIACQQTLGPQNYRAPCRHLFCFDCLRQLFEASYRGEKAWPARCCATRLPVETDTALQTVIEGESLRTYRKLAEEYDAEDRIYCGQTQCSAFIPKRFVVEMLDTAICPTCFSETCVKCKQAAHFGTCPIDEELERTKRLAGRRGWSTCSKCARVIEKAWGCNHMRYEVQDSRSGI